MSTIEFSTRNKTVKVSGSERPHLTFLLADIAKAFLSPGLNRELLTQAIPEGHYLNSEKSGLTAADWERDFGTALVSDHNFLRMEGSHVDVLHLILNTAWTAGGDTMKLAAAIDGQCELNAFIRGENRAWVADILRNDVSGIFRAGKGWEEVAEFLLESDDETVYMSYSVTGSVLDRAFNKWYKNALTERDTASLKGDFNIRLEEEWNALSEDTKWEHVEDWAKGASTYGRELSPKRWTSGFYFGEGWNAGNFVAVLEDKWEDERVKNPEIYA